MEIIEQTNDVVTKIIKPRFFDIERAKALFQVTGKKGEELVAEYLEIIHSCDLSIHSIKNTRAAMRTIIFKTDKIPKSDCFATEDIAYNYGLAQSESITDYYFYGTPQKIYSFATIMDEGLSYGFLHYHIPREHQAYFLEKYPELAKATNQIHYLYTAKSYRHAGNASQLLDYILQDMSEQGFQYVWLRCHITPELYYSKGFLTFTEAIRKICVRFDDFMSDYNEKIGPTDRIDRSFEDLRLVKICTVQ